MALYRSWPAAKTMEHIVKLGEKSPAAHIRSPVHTSVPDLSFDRLAVDLYTSGREFYPNSRLRLQVELVSSEAREKVGFSYS